MSEAERLRKILVLAERIAGSLNQHKTSDFYDIIQIVALAKDPTPTPKGHRS